MRPTSSATAWPGCGCAACTAGGRTRESSPQSGASGDGFFRFASAPGISDLLGLLRPSGRLLAIEVTRPGGQLRPEQEAFLDVFPQQRWPGTLRAQLGELQAALETVPEPEEPFRG